MVLFITCMPLSFPSNASMYFMSILLNRFNKSFLWYSLKPGKILYNPWGILYQSSSHFILRKLNKTLKCLLYLFFMPIRKGIMAAWFGYKNNAQIIYADLAFDSILASRVCAKLLNIPLISSVHDDPVERLQRKKYPIWIIKLFEKSFHKTLLASEKCVVISDYMGKYYKRQYGIKTETLFLGNKKKELFPIKNKNLNNGLLVGSIGSINCVKNWSLFIDACHLINKDHSKDFIKILHIGHKPKNINKDSIVHYTGWLDEKEFNDQLHKIDLGFITWSFKKERKITRMTSLPLKTHSYMKAGVPIFCISPSDSGINNLLTYYKIGINSSSQNIYDIKSDLDKSIREIKKQSYKTGIKKFRGENDLSSFYEKFKKIFSDSNFTIK